VHNTAIAFVMAPPPALQLHTVQHPAKF
jgi:hypothetical protein